MTLFSYCTCGARNDQAHYSNCTANDPPAAPDNGWRPIETAPKDGTWFMICCAQDGFESYEVGCFDPLEGVEYEEIEGGLFRKKTVPYFDWRGFSNFHRATHWAPLPAPPALTPPSVACVPSTNMEP